MRDGSMYTETGPTTTHSLSLNVLVNKRKLDRITFPAVLVPTPSAQATQAAIRRK